MKKVETSLLSMVIIHNQDSNEILLINRPTKKGFPGYIGAGGKIELTESFSEGAAREVAEETGLIVHPEDLIYKGVDEYVIQQEGYRYIVFNYVVTEYRGKLLTDPPEGELLWVPLEEAMDLPMQDWFRRRLPYFFQEGTFEISFQLKDFHSSPLKKNIRKIG